MIELLPIFPENVAAILCRVRMAKADYDSVLVPAVENALKKYEGVRIYYEIAPNFAGFDPGAMFEDFKVGMGHLTRWERIALVADQARYAAFQLHVPRRDEAVSDVAS